MDYYSLDERKKLQDKLEIDNKALDDVIANQGREERDIIDNYNSLGSTLGRMFGAYASVRGGANPSQVLQNYSNQLDTRLNNARNKYKDERESAFNRAKDTLSRLDAYNKGLMEQDKTAYQKERDRIADERADKELGLKEKSLNWQMSQGDLKQQQAQQDAQNAQDLQIKQKADILDRINNLKSQDKVAPTRLPDLLQGKEKQLSASEIQNINLAIIENEKGLTGKDALDYLNKNKVSYPTSSDEPEVVFGKWAQHGYQTTSQSPQEIEAIKTRRAEDAKYLKMLDKYVGQDKSTKLVDKFGGDIRQALKAYLRKPTIVYELDKTEDDAVIADKR